EIVPPAAVVDAVATLPVGERWLASESGGRATVGAAPLTIGAIGPAPGFTDDEHALLIGSGFAPMALATRRLRPEPAAVAWAAVWAAAGAARGAPAAPFRAG